MSSATASPSSTTGTTTASLFRASLTRETLQKALGLVALAASKKTLVDHERMVLVEATRDGLTFEANSGLLAIRHTVPLGMGVEVNATGAVAIPSAQLQRLAEALPPTPVTLAMAAVNQMRLTAGQHTARFLGLAAADVTRLDVATEGGWQIPAAALQAHIAKVSYAVSTEESRPILNGVLVEFRATSLTFTATTGHRLATLTVAADVPGARALDLILPPAALDAIAKCFAATETVTVTVSAPAGATEGEAPSFVTFQSPTTTLTARLIQGPYPEYRKVLPKNNDKRAEIDRHALMQALRRVLVMAGEQTHRVRCEFADAKLTITAESPDLGDCKDSVAIDYTGDPLVIGFNAAYLADALRRIPTPAVAIAMRAEELAATITPVDWKEPGVKSFVSLVMPLRLVG